MGWCFALINGRLGEIYFRDKLGRDGKPKFWAHCYVKREEFKTKRELAQIEEDIKHMKVAYRKKKYVLL